MRTRSASAPAESPENERSRPREYRPTTAEWERIAEWKRGRRAGERRVRLCCRGNKAPRRPAWRRNNRRRSRGHTTPYGAMPRRSVPLVRRLSEPRVRDSAAVHAEHRSTLWPFSFPCGRNPITSTWGLLALGRLPSAQQFENRGLQLRQGYGGQPSRGLPAVAHAYVGKRERRLVSRVGIEPTTRRLRVCCSAN